MPDLVVTGLSEEVSRLGTADRHRSESFPCHLATFECMLNACGKCCTLLTRNPFLASQTLGGKPPSLSTLRCHPGTVTGPSWARTGPTPPFWFCPPFRAGQSARVSPPHLIRKDRVGRREAHREGQQLRRPRAPNACRIGSHSLVTLEAVRPSGVSRPSVNPEKFSVHGARRKHMKSARLDRAHHR